MLARKVYNNDDIAFFFVYQRLESPRVILCCSPHRFTHRAAPHYHTRAWQTLIHGKECFILLLKRRVSRVFVGILYFPRKEVFFKQNLLVVLCFSRNIYLQQHAILSTGMISVFNCFRIFLDYYFSLCCCYM